MRPGPQAARSAQSWCWERGRAQRRSRGLDTHLEAPDVIHLPAQVEGPARRPGAHPGCGRARGCGCRPEAAT